MTLFDWYSGGFNVIVIALCEVCGIAWIYGMYTTILIASPRKMCRFYAALRAVMLRFLQRYFSCIFVRFSCVKQDMRYRRI